MGKIRIAKLGGLGEEDLRDKQKVKREEKKRRKEAKKKQEKIRISGMKGGERIKSVGTESEEELEQLAKLSKETEKKEEIVEKEKEEEKKVAKKRKRTRSQKYKQAAIKVDPKKTYSIKEALKLLREISLAKFDGTVEVHINTLENGLRGAVSLPHGTGKKIRVAIADQETIEKIIKKAKEGKIDFDILVAHPQVMSKLAKVAKILGPRGLMPNPKAGTISDKPEKLAEKYKKGEIAWKTESKFPIVHQAIGKLSFADKQLEENFNAFIQSVSLKVIKNITLKSTMSPGIKVKIN
jgi:large subunit ribosomal protein L1